MSVDTKLAFDQEYIKNFSKDRGEPEWLLNFRLKALELAEKVEMPKPDKTKIDNWNFTGFKHEVAKADQVTSFDQLHEDVKALIDENVKEHNLIVQRDATPIYTQVSDNLKSKGVIFTDIATAAREHSDLLEKYFMTDAVHVDENRLVALHAALLNGGVFVYVPKNVVLEEPLQTIFWQENPEAGLFNHVIVVAEDNSSVTYVENYVSFDNQVETVANIVAEVYAAPGAKVSFGAVDNFAQGVTTYVNRRGYVARDAKVEWALGQMNDGYTVSENTTHLIGDGSFADSKTVSIGRGEQKQNFTTNIVHHGKHSEGYILTHGVMRESASSIFNGITKIEHGAAKSNGEQTERVLMLSERARGDANPILLIDEDDVTAGHAASVGRIDPLQMFYLMSRGIPKHEAERLVIHGFLAPVVGQLPVETVKERLTEVIEGKVK
ncbi:Fe-S cluster assembly protein SufD [Desertibacillus haloalkaliphilus]|uniref:Fe-S cluster assembly protein SufD n=1 Tax=Desertibacillus haloalkaliphilus TaxID=1328930 RepID=UPI001C27E79D|nr:Fe-S cluster assembly protein SufD [Desertibacillus haloalkaliphilus]MBU8906613.1 Fe-S cluster assembly protein SufD [Desertibacillus haloalkaliphilus]